MTADALARAVASRRWHHTIDLGHGIVTPGLWSRAAQAHITTLMDRIDFRGRHVLDVGTLDGQWAFEAERRGAASVLTIDVAQPPHDADNFALARQAIDSDVHREIADVEDFDRPGDFDLILFLGVYYHLKNPLRALANLARALSPGGMLAVEGEVGAGTEPTARFCHHTVHAGDPSNWWVPTVPCLREWVESAGFTIDAADPVTMPAGPFARHILLARKP